MNSPKCYDLFVTHAWRFHDDWSQFADLMDQGEGVEWRNFSLPWHDPAIKPSTELGGRFIRNNLECQIIPAQVVILLAGVYSINSARKWLDLEIEFARKHEKPILGMPAFGEDAVPEDVEVKCNTCVSWDIGKIKDTIGYLSEIRETKG